MRDAFDFIADATTGALIFGGAVWGVSTAYIKASNWIVARRSDKRAIAAVDEAFRTPESDARLAELNRQTDSLLKSRRDPG